MIDSSRIQHAIWVGFMILAVLAFVAILALFTIAEVEARWRLVSSVVHGTGGF